MRAAIYCRVSTPGQKNTTSLPEQERLCREHAAQLGWEVSEPHVYREVEGGEDLYRPCMDRLWDSIIHREIDAVVVDVLDRLGRDEGDQGAFYHHCDRYGVSVELACQDIDETENGRNLRTLSGMVARMERVDIRRRTQRGRKARAAQGKIFPSGFPLFGYLFADADKGRYIVDPETAPTVVRIFEAVADSVPIRRLVSQFDAEGVPTPGQVLVARGQFPAGRSATGLYWHPSVIRRILHHPAYWGRHGAYRYQKSTITERPANTGITRKVRRMTERAEDDSVRVALPASACPALVPPELASRVHARLSLSKAESAGRNPDPLATIWRGMAFCGHCGGRLNTAPTTLETGRRYRCARVLFDAQSHQKVRCSGGKFAIGAKVLDPAAWADVVAWLTDEENVAQLLADWQEECQNNEHSITSHLEAVTAQLTMLHNKMAALAEAIGETNSREGRQVLQEKLDQYADRVRTETAKRERLLHEAHEARDYAQAALEIREWIRLVAKEAATFTPAEQRDTLRALGAQVTVWRTDYMHADGWPQRYRITLHFTGLRTARQPLTLPPAQSAIVKQASTGSALYC